MRCTGRLGALAWLIVSSGCHGGHIHPIAGEVVKASPQSGPSSADADVLIIADTHASDPRAPHDLKSNSYYTDKLVGAAIRPPQLDLWGTRMLDWVLTRPRRPKVVIHLGDAANIACVSEFARFADAMVRYEQAGGAPWYMAPGNHDSLLMGNWAYESPADGTDTRWGRECGGDRTMDKHEYMARYRDAKHWDKPKEATPNGRYSCYSLVTHDNRARATECDYRADEGDGKLYEWGSFLIQEVALDPDVTMILLDTTGYRERPRLRQIGGTWGGISDEQLEIARSWMSDAGARRIVLAGHYPTDALDKPSREGLKHLIEQFPAVTYLSAHTHSSATARLLHDASGKGAFLELNLGSVVAWPMEYAYLTIRPQGSETRLELSVDSAALQLVDECQATWHGEYLSADDDSYYTRYGSEGGYAELAEAMFRQEQRVFDGSLPADFDEQEVAGARPAAFASGSSDAIVGYERCQAVFASAAEAGIDLNSTRVPSAGWLSRLADWLIAPLEDPRPEDSSRLRDDAVPESMHTWIIGARTN